MRQQLINPTVGPGRQLVHHVFEVNIWVMPIELGRLDQTHDGRRTLAGPQ